MKLSDLVALSSKELAAAARERKLKGRGSMSQADLVLALTTDPVTADVEAVVRGSSSDLYARAKAAGVEGYSKLSKAGLQAALLDALVPAEAEEPEAPAEAAEDPAVADRVVRVYWPLQSRDEADVVAYCWPAHRAGIYTYLHNGEATFHAAIARALRSSETQEAAVRRLMREAPDGVEVVDPPR